MDFYVNIKCYNKVYSYLNRFHIIGKNIWLHHLNSRFPHSRLIGLSKQKTCVLLVATDVDPERRFLNILEKRHNQSVALD